METTHLYPRYARDRLREALTDSPVTLIHGPRQCGKTTLARVVGDPLGYAYLNFDDDVVRESAAEDPARPQPIAVRVTRSRRLSSLSSTSAQV